MVGWCSVAQSCPTLYDPLDFSTTGLPVPHHLPKFAQVHFISLVMPSSHFILWCPFLLLPSILPSIRNFSNESSVHFRWPEYWSFSFSICPSSEYSGLIFLMIDWFDLLAVQGTFKSLRHTVWRHPLYWSKSHHFTFYKICPSKHQADFSPFCYQKDG